MASTVKGLVDWNLQIDKDGHREYKAQWLCVSNDVLDGPQVVANSTGLPAVGSTWAYGNDLDAWAFCWPTWRVSPVMTKEPDWHWIVEQTFSTKPLNRCQDTDIENPLDEPDRVGGSFVKYTKEATQDKDGNPIESSSHEPFVGSVVEFDANRPNVWVKKNVGTLPLATFSQMVDTVNDAALWGLPTRCVKLSNASWERQLYGTCTYYYTVNYEFDIDYTTFDRVVWDEGTRVLSKGGDPDNPKDFEVYKDRNGENTRVFLNGAGVAIDDVASVFEIDIQYYNESNFLLLGIPTSF